MFTLRITTICTWQVAKGTQDILRRREEELQIVRAHQNKLVSDPLLGRSIVRRFAVHNETTSTLEQNVSICVKRKSGGWIALVWLDVGRDLTKSHWQPSIGGGSLHLNTESLCLPVIQHREMLAEIHERLLRDQPMGGYAPARSPTYNSGSSAQSAALIPEQYGSHLRASTAQVDVLYALTELFSFAVGSEYQFLNLMQSQISEAMRFLKGQEELSLGTLRYTKVLVDEHIIHIRDTVAFLEAGGDPSWPRAVEESDKLLVEATVSCILGDYRSALQRAEGLASQAVEGINIILNSSMLVESRNAILQAKDMKRLSLLAFLFLPLAFTTSVFGMNFKEFGTGDLSIWVAPCLLVPATVTSLLICFWDRFQKPNS